MHKKALSAVSAFAMAAVMLCFSAQALAAQTADVSVILNGKQINFDSAPVIVDDVTMVEVRPLAEALGCSVKWSQNTQSVKLTSGKVGVVLKMDYDIMTKTDLTGNDDGDLEQIQLSAPPVVEDGVAYVPLRSVAEAFGAALEWDDENAAVKISTGDYSYSKEKASQASRKAGVQKGNNGHTFYFQNQQAWELPNFGSGYCWTCSYAMLISDVIGETVTPLDVATVNESKGGNGAYCYHWDIADAFGVKFIPALDESSPYYGGMDSNSGGTKVNNPDNDEDVAVEALKEALDRNPAGVMVRYAAYPHTMVAVGYEGDTIYFNEPMQISSSEYLDVSSKCNIPFEESCIAKRGISIAQITFIQAIAED